MSDIHPLLPELFDLDYGDFEDDMTLYENFARAADGPVLDLGVGTGRIVIPLAQAGYDVWGIDNAGPMLERATSTVEPAAADRLHLVEGDMREFKLGQTFALICAGLGSFHHLLSTDDQLACLRCVIEHLSPGGTFVCDLYPIFLDAWELDESTPLVHDWTRILPSTGETVTKTRTIRSDSARQVRHQTNFYDLVDANGAVRRIVEEVDLRFTTRYEMEGLLQNAGLELEHMYGDYDLTPFDEISEHMITVARKPEDS